MSSQMTVKDLHCTLNMPKQLKSNDQGHVHELPPFAPVDSYPVDMYPACPSNWMNGSDIASSYFVQVEEGKGMWLDFNACSVHTHDVAVVISIQGVNPITGQKTDQLRLEQYKKKCPIHKVNFKQDKFCPKCKFKWPDQNYLTTTGTPAGGLWLDGFRTPDGKVRQYIFTEEEMKGIAKQVIGKDRVFAIGIAFYLSKDKKPRADVPSWRDLKNKFKDIPNDCHDWQANINHTSPMYFSPTHTLGNWNLKGRKGAGSSASMSTSSKNTLNSMRSKGSGPTPLYTSSLDTPVDACLGASMDDIFDAEIGCVDELIGEAAAEVASEERLTHQEVKPVKNLEIGAGALIDQQVYADTQSIDYWQPEPTGMVYINYCDEQTAKKIFEAGKIAEKAEGFMEGLVVGS